MTHITNDPTATSSVLSLDTIAATVRAHIAAADEAADLNGFTVRDDAAALALAASLDAQTEPRSGALVRGWVVAVKDNIHVAGLPNSAGTPHLRSFVPESDAPVVSALKENGAIVLGKANMHELALGMTSNNVTFGAVRNPFDRLRTCGGSSGGTASLVASGAARFGLGTDTGGSVRVPASFTGLFGLRPTTGRYDGHGVTPLSQSRDTVGIMTRTADDLEIVDRAISGDTAPATSVDLNGLSLGIPESVDTAVLDPEVKRVWEQTITALEAAGVAFVRVDTGAADRLDATWGMPVVFAEAYPELTAYLDEYVPGLALDDLLDGVAMPDVRATLLANRASGEDIATTSGIEARTGRSEARAVMAALFEASAVSALIFPTAPVPAPLIDVEDATMVLADETVDSFPTLIRYTATGSFVGLPGTTFPAGATATGLPVGVALDGPEGSDRALIAITAALAAAVAKA